MDSESLCSCRLDQGKYLLRGLHPVHGLLHQRVKILHPKAQAIETQLRQVLQALGIHGARVHFDGILAPWCKAEMAPQHDHEFSQLRIGQEGGAAAAQMQLTDTLPWADMSHQCKGLPHAQGSAGRRRPFVVFGDDLVAGAVVTTTRKTECAHTPTTARHRAAGPLRR